MLSDTHNDFFTKLDSLKCVKYLENCKRMSVKNLLCSVFSSEYTKTQALHKICEADRTLKDFDEKNFLLHIEDLSFVQDTKDNDFILSLRPFSCSLTWNNDNQFAGGNFGNSGLLPRGKKMIEQMEEHGIILDTAHLNRESFFEAVKTTGKPIFCSHTGLDFVCPSPRNLSDRQVETIIESGGYFGLFLSSTFMNSGKQMTSRTFAEIIYKTLCRFDCENNLGIGSDFFGIDIPPKDINFYTDFAKVEEELLLFGITKSTINKIFYKNFENFLAKTKAPPPL